MTTRFSNSILHKTEEVGLVDNNLIRSIATNIINHDKCEYNIGVECFYCWHEVMNDLRIWALVKNKNEKSVSAVFSDSIIECLYPGVLKMINKINEFKNFNFLFSKNHNEVYYNDSKYLFSNEISSLLFKSRILLFELKFCFNILKTADIAFSAFFLSVNSKLSLP